MCSVGMYLTRKVHMCYTPVQYNTGQQAVH